MSRSEFWGLLAFYVLGFLAGAFVGAVVGWSAWARRYYRIGEPGSILGLPIPIVAGALIGGFTALIWMIEA